MPISTVTANFVRRNFMSKSLIVLALLAISSLALSSPAAAQQPRRGSATKKTDKTAPATKKAEAPLPAASREIDPVTLPPDFEPPQPQSEVMQINRPLLTEEQLETLKKKYDSKFSSLLNRTTWTDAASKEAIRGGLQYRLAQFTILENRDKWLGFRSALMRDISKMGLLAPNPQATIDARRFLLTEVVQECQKLLDNNFWARVHAVFILSELNLTEEDTKKNLKLEAFLPAIEPLVKVLEDPAQPEAVKILAVRGVVRLLSNSSPPVKVKQAVAAALVAQLSNEKAHPWYQKRLAYAMSTVDIAVDLNGKPILVTTLQKVVADPKRDWITRAEACRSLGRVAYDPSVDTKGVLSTIASFAAEAATAAQAAARDPHWKAVFGRLYLTFREQDAEDRDVERKGPGGLLNRTQFNQSSVKQVYQPVVDVFNALIAGNPIPVDAAKALQALQKPQPGLSQNDQ